MCLDRSRSRIGLRMHTRDVHAQPIPVHPFSTVTALGLLENARLPVWVFRAMVTLMLQNTTGGEKPPAKNAPGVLRGTRLHFQFADIRLPSFVSAE